mmetsp:Transcript_61049/g.108651  ORF Transcript_61049/g.108651 Transcript_61049/m.108651 type:complete len:265 (+) Transcript_61049:101-895(+)
MVYIEERIEQLEKTVKTLEKQLETALAQLNDRKRKADVVTQDMLDKAVEDLQASIDKKLPKADLDQAVADGLDKAKLKDSTLGKVVNEERLAKAVAAMQSAIDSKLSGTVMRDQLQQQLAIMQGPKVTPQQFQQSMNNLQAQINQKAQENKTATNAMQGMVQQLQGTINGVVAPAIDWRDVSLADQMPFDVTKAYRLRIGDGPAARWVYSTDVSMGCIYTTCNILDQSISINSNTKSSYAARKLGAAVDTTAYFAVFQLQMRGL